MQKSHYDCHYVNIREHGIRADWQSLRFLPKDLNEMYANYSIYDMEYPIIQRAAVPPEGNEFFIHTRHLS